MNLGHEASEGWSRINGHSETGTRQATDGRKPKDQYLSVVTPARDIESRNNHVSLQEMDNTQLSRPKGRHEADGLASI